MGAFLPSDLLDQGNRYFSFLVMNFSVASEGKAISTWIKKKVELIGSRALPWLSLLGLATSSAFQHHVSQCRVKEKLVQQQPCMSWNLFLFIDLNRFPCSVSQHLPGCVAITTKPQIPVVFNSTDSFFFSHSCCISAVSGLVGDPYGLFLLKSRWKKQPLQQGGTAGMAERK